MAGYKKIFIDTAPFIYLIEKNEDKCITVDELEES